MLIQHLALSMLNWPGMMMKLTEFVKNATHDVCEYSNKCLKHTMTVKCGTMMTSSGKCKWRYLPTSCDAVVSPQHQKQNPEAKCICLAVNIVKLTLHT